jgi:hypothetical protein
MKKVSIPRPHHVLVDKGEGIETHFTRLGETTRAQQSLTPFGQALNWRSSSHYQTNKKQNQKHHEQYPCDLRRCAGDSAKSQNSGNERYHKKSYRPI